MTMLRNSAAGLVCALLFPVAGWASLGADSEPTPPKPPQEAVDACHDKSEGASVQMTSPSGESLSGTCRQQGGVLAAVPERSGAPLGAGGPPKDGIKEPWEL